MGGERGGRYAADLALKTVLAAGPLRSLDAARHAVRAADTAIAQAASEDLGSRAGMGCALGVLALAPQRGMDGPVWIAAHAGDVRILSRSPDGAVRLETRDHTPAFARWEAGEIALDEIPEADGANRLQRAVGRGGEADAGWLPVRPGWSYVLVSDGVTKAMRLDELGEAMACPTADAACDFIRRKVEERGPDDNFTALAVRVVNPDQPLSPDRTPDVAATRRSPLAGLAALLSLAALALAGYVWWTTNQARETTATRSEVSALQAQVDSLRARLPETDRDTVPPFVSGVLNPSPPQPAAPTAPRP
jgi:serine/threonine protein phosphatase PrpC